MYVTEETKEGVLISWHCEQSGCRHIMELCWDMKDAKKEIAKRKRQDKKLAKRGSIWEGSAWGD